MKISCFVSNLMLTPNRAEWAAQTLKALSAVPAIDLTVLDAGSDPKYLSVLEGFNVIQMPREGSLFRRYLLAEALSISEYLLLCDNDMLPKREGWLSQGLEIARRNPQFGHIVYRMEHSDFPGDHGAETSEIRSITKGGGINLIKRDARTASFRIPFVFDSNNADDKCYCEAIRKSGYLVGQFQQLYTEHLGRSESTQAF